MLLANLCGSGGLITLPTLVTLISDLLLLVRPVFWLWGTATAWNGQLSPKLPQPLDLRHLDRLDRRWACCSSCRVSPLLTWPRSAGVWNTLFGYVLAVCSASRPATAGGYHGPALLMPITALLPLTAILLVNQRSPTRPCAAGRSRGDRHPRVSLLAPPMCPDRSPVGTLLSTTLYAIAPALLDVLPPRLKAGVDWHPSARSCWNVGCTGLWRLE